MRRSFRIALLVVTTLAADHAWAEPFRYCGDDYWFTTEPPRGWEISSDVDHMGLNLVFHPSGRPEPVITVILVIGSESMEPRAVDLDASLSAWIGLVSTFGGSPSRIRDWNMRHPTQPTRSAVLEGEGGRMYLSVIDAGSGRGHTFTVFSGHAGSRASAEMLRGFQNVVSSLHFDATRVCEPGPGGRVVERRIEPPSPPAAAATTSQEAFPIERAMNGCATLQQSFVPVICLPAREGEREAWVVSFDDGDDPASTYLERFRDHITAPWCWVARGRADAPLLLFRTSGSDSLREYSCETSGWVRTVSVDRLKRVMPPGARETQDRGLTRR